ncbi:hypothetical protein BKA61DRAFT_596214 [Leptodontidium sp. MPI-SDFR-AT-0119]|nr:hypothetical protein BKA61DRAFT_596214 [Leptodontidium sp. MPI-SDFR-AT-0119]
MGGSAFIDLFTPRMPPDIYNLILSQTLTTIQKHFTHVSSPIEAPGKADFGDIDILCHGPLTPPYNPSLTPKAKVTETIAKELGAKSWIVGKSMQGMNLAIPWPDSHPDHSTSDENHETPGEGEGEGEEERAGGEEERFIQLDIHIFTSLKQYNWELFHAAHGDLWNILGSTIRRFGLTVNNLGLFLRIPDIELLDRKKSMVFLTDDSTTILDFLGLDPERWWCRFESQDEMFEYAAGCRLFWIKEVMEDGEGEGDVVGEIPIEGNRERETNAGQEGGEAGKKKLKHNDRQRMDKRPIFRTWIEDFIPKCREQGRFLEMRSSREQVRDEAFEKFGVREEFDTRLREWKLERHKDEMWRGVIKGSVPTEDVDPQFRAASVRFLRAVLMDGELWEGSPLKEAERDGEGMWDLEAVRRFVEGNWEEAGRLGMVFQQKRALESMKAKAEKKATLAGVEKVELKALA